MHNSDMTLEMAPKNIVLAQTISPKTRVWLRP